MNNLYRKLEFDIVLQQVSEFASNTFTKDRIINLKHNIEYHKVVELLTFSQEITFLINSYGLFKFNNFYNLDETIKKVRQKQLLSGLELKQISYLNDIHEDLKTYHQQIDKEKYPMFNNIIEKLDSLLLLAQEINYKINSEGLIYEDASENLIRINKIIKENQNKINELFKKIISEKFAHLSDGIITFRNNRAVLPVKATSRNVIKGIIHDESSSKQTVFIEPSSVIALNNEIQSLEYEKNDEIKKILSQLSSQANEYYESINNNFHTLINLDEVMAKALYGKSINGIIPHINKNSAKLEIFQGKHPLIDKDNVVANDFYIANDSNNNRIVLISGPNTGGKSVSLKMIGLFSLMAQSGIPISANDKTNLPIYQQIFVDIGDEQSISSSLSTFSSHLTNIIKISEQVTSKSLVLLDELGSGTDPREGENLAIAILEFLYQKDASVVVSTHFSKLKNYALTNEYVRSASVLFDEETSMPTYKLLFDTYASSNAFEIASNLGLNNQIVEHARKLYHDDLSQSDELLLKINAKEIELKKELLMIEEIKSDLSAKQKSYQEQLMKFETSKDRIINQAHEKANDIIRNAQHESKRLIEKLKKQDNFINHDINKIRSELDDLVIVDKPMIDNKNIDFKQGDHVEIIKINRQGIISKVLKNDSYEVSIGNLKTKVNKNEIRLLKSPKKENKDNVKVNKKINNSIPFEINLIGQRVDDAMVDLRKYLDSAVASNYTKVRIVHGFGTGALRKAVHEYLKKNKNVKNYYFAKSNEGGQGATIVEIG